MMISLLQARREERSELFLSYSRAFTDSNTFFNKQTIYASDNNLQ